MTIPTVLKHKFCLSLVTFHKYVVQSTDPTPIIYLYAINFFKYASTIYNLVKAMFVYLALSETHCIIYRPDMHNSQASRKKLKK